MAGSSGPTPLPNPFLSTSSIDICNSMGETWFINAKPNIR